MKRGSNDGLCMNFHLLSRGWLGCIFRSVEDANAVMKGMWFLDNSMLSLKS